VNRTTSKYFCAFVVINIVVVDICVLGAATAAASSTAH
jgi:hypothetical protein